jgi:mRNA interferase RelE/StbE
MDEYSITFARPARKELERLHEPLCSRILERIEALAWVPRPAGCRKLEGRENLWRIRVGDYRVVYSIEDQNRLIDIIAIGHRGDVYR